MMKTGKNRLRDTTFLPIVQTTSRMIAATPACIPRIASATYTL